ncbi:MAG: hypothetical protein ABR920_08760 [Terriglobales bacterium]|jgi:hypothetical protein
MLILFDQGTAVGIRNALHGHVVRTAHEQGWSTFLNGDLLRAAEDAGFEVFLTTDKNLVYQQNLSNRKIAIVVLGKSRWSLIEPVLQRVSDAVNAAKPASYTLVEIPGE